MNEEIAAGFEQNGRQSMQEGEALSKRALRERTLERVASGGSSPKA